MLTINNYFDGKVASIGLQTNTLPASVGVMDIGEYQFNTNQHEVMTVISGQLTVKLSESNEWHVINAGESFDVAADTVFKLKVAVQTAYFCTYENK